MLPLLSGVTAAALLPGASHIAVHDGATLVSALGPGGAARVRTLAVGSDSRVIAIELS